MRFFAGIAVVGALVAAFVFTWFALLTVFAAVAVVAGIARLLGRGRRPQGPVTIEGESRRVE